MKQLLYCLFSWISLILSVNCGKIRPFGARSIVLSSTNAGDLSNYNFTMTLDTPLPSNGVIQITFPFNQYIAGLGLPYHFKVYAPFPTAVISTLDSAYAKTIICQVGKRNANESFTIEIQNVRNPSKIGGTGSFKVKSLVGSKIIDINNNFGSIGIFPSSTDLLSADIKFEESASQLAGEPTTYILSFIPSVNLPSLIDVKVVFADLYDFSNVKPYQCSEYGSTIGLNLTCKLNPMLKNVIIFEGFNQVIAQGTKVRLMLKNVINPSKEMTTDALSYWIRETGTNNTIQKTEGVAGLYINPGRIYDVSLYNPYSSFPVYTNMDRELILTFRPANAFNVIKIATHFPLVKKCTVINGLSQVNEITPIMCSASSHVMVIKGQATYIPNDIYLQVVKIKLIATVPSLELLTNKVEIYTFLDQGFIEQVDQDLDSAATQIQTIPLTTTQSNTPSGVVSTGASPLGTTTLTFNILASADRISVPYVKVEVGKDFNGLPSCRFSPRGSAVLASKTCALKDGIITVYINDDILTSIFNTTNPPTLIISNLKNPPLPGAYDLRLYVFSTSNIVQEYYSTSTTINQEPFTSITMLPLARTYSQTTMYVLTFTNPTFLDDGYFLYQEPNKQSSRIDIIFKMQSSGVNTFTYDLGSGLPDRSDYPCEFVGILASKFATKSRCILIHGPSSGVASDSVVTIRVFDFRPIVKGVQVQISIPVLNAGQNGATPEAIVRTYVLKEYEEYLMAEQLITLLTTNNNVGASTTSTTISLTNSSVQALSDLSFTFTSTSITAGSNSSIKIEYPHGYNFSTSTIVVKLDGVTVPPSKLHFAIPFDFFTIELGANLGAGPHTILVQNMRTPNASLSSGNVLNVRTVQSQDYVDTIAFNLPSIAPGHFKTNNITMSIFPDTLGHPYATYKFNFTTTAYSSSDSVITIVFPVAYTLDPSYAECTQIIGLNPLSSTQSPECVITATTVTIQHFAALVPAQSIYVEIFGITNPSSSLSAGQFSINVLDSNSQSIETFSIAANSSTLSSSVFAAQNLNITEAHLTPRNPYVDAAYSMSMTLDYALPKGASIQITFDSNFGLLFTEDLTRIECTAEGGLEILYDCSAAGVILTMVLGETSTANETIDIYYFGLIRYPNSNTTLNPFAVTVSYKGSAIASISASDFPILESSDVPTPLSSIALDYYPRNEGEMANYLFTFTLSAYTQVNSSMHFMVRFPYEYDPYLYKYTPYAESQQLIGALTVEVRQRQIIIYGFQNMTVTGPITVRLWGIINPNKIDISRTGYFTFALMYQDEALEASFNIKGIIPLIAPDSIQFMFLNSTIPYSRYVNNFNMQLLSKKSILSSKLGGLLFVDFPPDFLIDSFGGNCDIDEAFSFFVSCSVDNNRFFVNASNPEWTESMGALNLMLQDVRTPDFDGETLNFVISNYDSKTKRILSRTYSTLNPASLTYTYDGYLISVNDDEPIYVEVGTYTDEITIKMPSASLQTLTFTPNTLDPTILITPFPLKIELGETEVTFRVSAPREILLKEFYITWSKTGDSLVATYTNLKRTPLRMVKGYVKRNVAFENMEFIPVGGRTFPLDLYTNNPPYDGVKIYMRLLSGDTRADLSSSYVTFDKGQYKESYSIAVADNHALSNVKVQFDIGGKDGDSYELLNNVLTIPIVVRETSDPEILQGRVVSTTRSTVTFNITGSTLSFIYYTIAHRKMPTPSFTEVKNGDISNLLNDSYPIFGASYIKRTPKTIQFSVNDLTPGMDYVFYAYIMNLNGAHNKDFLKLEFSTNPPQRISEFVLQIKQSFMSKDLKRETISRIAQMLSIDRARLIEKSTDCVQNQDALYFNLPNTTYFHLYLLPDPTNENPNSTPLSLVRNLNSRTDEIRQFVPRLVEGDLLQIQELPLDMPFFAMRPTVYKQDYFSITMKFTLARCGELYVLIVPRPNSQGDKSPDSAKFAKEELSKLFPTSFQIYSGLNSTNQPVTANSARVNDFGKDFLFTVNGLADNLIYDFYFTTRNDWPIYNQILPNSDVIRFTVKTVKKRKPLNIFSINNKKGFKRVKAKSKSSILAQGISWFTLAMILLFNLVL